MKTKAFLFLSVLVAATSAKKRVEDTGSIGNTPDQFAAQIIAEFEVCIKVVSTAKLKFD